MNSPPFLPSKQKDQTDRVVSDRICLLVLGMHRSGTSAVTRVLSIAGAKLPASLMGPGRGNEVGHWESDAIATYNDELLSQLGSRWGDWRSLELARLPLNRRRDIQAEIADLLAAEFGDAALFVVKDPRICRFARLFIDALDGAGIEPRMVHMVRNPLEVAESLERRDNMNRGDAALQWLRHVLDSEASTRTRSRVIVTYASLLKDWRTTLERITDTLRVTWPYAIDDVAGQVAQFLDRDRRHHEHSVEDVLLDPTLRGWMGEAYSALLVLESNPDSKAAMTTLDSIRREFNHAGPILHALLADAQSASERQRAAVAAEREQEASHLRGALGETEARIAQLGAALEERDQRIAGLGTVIDARSAEVQGLAASAAEREREAVELRAALGEARDSAAASLAERERATTELRAALDAAETRARDSAASLAEREQATAELRAALDAAETRARDGAASLAERERATAELRAALDAAETRARDGAASLAERERATAELRAALEAAETRARDGAASVGEREREAADLQSALRNAETRASEIAASVAEREQEGAALKAALRIAETRALRLVAALEESGRRIGGLDGALRREKHEAEQLVARLAEREAEGENLRATLNAAEKALGASEKEVAEIQALAEKRARRLESEKQALLQQADLGYQKLIDHFRSSTSWKVTRPLRALKDWLPHASFRPRRPRLRVRKAKGRSGAAAVIEESGLFNERYYLSFVRDETIGDPIGHYLQHGSKKGVDPNPLFDSDFYTTRYAAHLDEIANPFVHFIQSGARQGFDPSPLFQTGYYRRSNLDVQTSEINPLLHYLKFGRTEGRMPIDADPAGFNALALRMHRLDLASPDSDRFDADLYAALYPEIVAAIGGDDGALASHFETSGRAEGRIASLGAFVRALGMPPEAVPINFDASEYYELNADLGSAFPHTFFHAIRHYLESGIRERRRYSYSQCYIDAPWQAAANIVAVAAPQAESAAHKVACLLHVGRSELWPGLLRQARALDGVARDVFVSVADAVWSEELHAQIRGDIPGASIVISESDAGDGGGYVDSLAGVQLDDYAGFLLIPSAAAKDGKLNGSMPEAPPIAVRLARMTADPSIGIIGAGGGQEKSGGPVLVSAKVLKRALELVGRQGDEFRGEPEPLGSRLLADVCASVGSRAHWN